MRKKLPHEEELDKLLDSVENIQVEEDQGIEDPSDVVKFLSFYNVLPGKHLVTKRVLYELYRRWSPKPERVSIFNFHVSKYILVHQKGPRLYYMINKSALKLNKESYKLFIDKKLDKTKSPSFKKHFEDFLRFYKIQSGTHWVESFVLYHLYDKWTYETNTKSYMSERHFFNFCMLYFKNKRRTSDKHQWFAINDHIKVFTSKEMIENLRKARKRGEKKNKKKSSGVSSP